jgi:hypothetical protein
MDLDCEQQGHRHPGATPSLYRPLMLMVLASEHEINYRELEFRWQPGMDSNEAITSAVGNVALIGATFSLFAALGRGPWRPKRTVRPVLIAVII